MKIVGNDQERFKHLLLFYVFLCHLVYSSESNQLFSHKSELKPNKKKSRSYLLYNINIFFKMMYILHIIHLKNKTIRQTSDYLILSRQTQQLKTLPYKILSEMCDLCEKVLRKQLSISGWQTGRKGDKHAG